VKASYVDAPGVASTTALYRRSDSEITASLTLTSTGSSAVAALKLYLDGTAGADYADGMLVADWGSNRTGAKTWPVPTNLPLGSHTWHVVATVSGSSKHWAFPVTVAEAFAVDTAIR
jgi:hypothetical protein